MIKTIKPCKGVLCRALCYFTLPFTSTALQLLTLSYASLPKESMCLQAYVSMTMYL